MKIAPGKIASVLRDPQAIRIILLHGEDEGLVRSRADALTKAVIGAADDPFRVAWLAREDHGRLEEEASAIAMLGGRRVVRVRDVVDGLATAVERVARGAGESLEHVPTERLRSGGSSARKNKDVEQNSDPLRSKHAREHPPANRDHPSDNDPRLTETVSGQPSGKEARPNDKPALSSNPSRSEPSLVLLEAGALTRRGKLLTLLEALPNAGVIACYPEEGAGLRTAIEAGLAQSGVRADRDALDWLRDHLGGDHASTRGEIEKLVLYAAPAENGSERRLDLDDVQACVGDQALVSLDDALFAATAGDVVAADRAVERSFAEGAAAIGLIRAMLLHLTRVHAARGRMATGATAAEAVKLMRPPVFWKREAEMVRAVGAWTAERVATAMLETRRAELACKQTGAPDGVIARRLILALARQSARR